MSNQHLPRLRAEGLPPFGGDTVVIEPGHYPGEPLLARELDAQDASLVAGRGSVVPSQTEATPAASYESGAAQAEVPGAEVLPVVAESSQQARTRSWVGRLATRLGLRREPEPVPDFSDILDPAGTAPSEQVVSSGTLRELSPDQLDTAYKMHQARLGFAPQPAPQKYTVAAPQRAVAVETGHTSTPVQSQDPRVAQPALRLYAQGFDAAAQQPQAAQVVRTPQIIRRVRPIPPQATSPTEQIPMAETPLYTALLGKEGIDGFAERLAKQQQAEREAQHEADAQTARETLARLAVQADALQTPPAPVVPKWYDQKMGEADTGVTYFLDKPDSNAAYHREKIGQKCMLLMRVAGVSAYPDGTFSRVGDSGQQGEVLVHDVDTGTTHGLAKAYDTLIEALSSPETRARNIAYRARLESGLSAPFDPTETFQTV